MGEHTVTSSASSASAGFPPAAAAAATAAAAAAAVQVSIAVQLRSPSAAPSSRSVTRTPAQHSTMHVIFVVRVCSVYLFSASWVPGIVHLNMVYFITSVLVSKF